MKYLIVFLLTISTAYSAEIVFNPLRSGEGAVVSETSDNRLAIIFFSHTKLNPVVPPIISPQPPAPIFCDEQNVFLTMISDIYDGNIAYGTIYYSKQNEGFPDAVDDRVSEEHIVGAFSAAKLGDGFLLVMERDPVMCNLTIFGEPHFLTSLLAE